MANNTSAIVDVFVERLRAAREIAVMALAVVCALQNLLDELAMWHDVDSMARDVVIAEEQARRALELWNRFWSIALPPAGEQKEA